MDLGAARQVFLRVTLPLILPGIVAAAMLSFALSLDDFIITYFNSGSTVTYPLYINAATKTGLPPQINVLATAILLVSLVLLGASTLWQRRRLAGDRDRRLDRPDQEHLRVTLSPEALQQTAATTSGATSPGWPRAPTASPSSSGARAATCGTATASATSTACRACSPCRPGTAARAGAAAGAQAAELAYFPLWTYAHPTDRAGRPPGGAGAGQPQPGLLHHRRQRGRRAAWKLARSTSRHRPAPAAQGDRATSPTTARRWGPCRSPAWRPSGRRSSRWCRACPRPQHQPLPVPLLRRRPACTLACADEIEAAILREEPETVAAVYLEPVQNSGGCFTPSDGYFARVREICDRYGVLLVSDEVICAFGGSALFGSERLGYQPDMITMAKGLVGLLAARRRAGRRPHRRAVPRAARRSSTASRSAVTP